MDISIVIPVYNSSSTLRALSKRLHTVLSDTNRKYEIIFVDDESSDDSWQLLCELQNKHPGSVTVIQLMRNFGQHNALMAGFRYAKGKFVITMDDDLQNPPEEIPKLLDTIIENNYDLVYASYGSKKHAKWRNLGSTLAIKFYQIVFKSDIAVTSFRVIRRKLLESIFTYNLNYTYIDGLLAWNTRRIGSVEVAHMPRRDGVSGYSLSKLLLLSVNLFTNFSILPLQFVSIVGLGTALLGILVGGFYLLQALLSDISVPGYASTITSIMLLGGIQLLALGMIGEYIGRLHININRKPQYTIRQIQPDVNKNSVEDDQNRNDS